MMKNTSKYQEGVFTMNTINCYADKFGGYAYFGVDDGYIYIVADSKRYYFFQYYNVVNLYPQDEFEKFYRNVQYFVDKDGKALEPVIIEC